LRAAQKIPRPSAEANTALNGALIQHGAGEIAIRSRVLPMAVPLPSRSTLENCARSENARGLANCYAYEEAFG